MQFVLLGCWGLRLLGSLDGAGAFSVLLWAAYSESVGRETFSVICCRLLSLPSSVAACLLVPAVHEL